MKLKNHLLSFSESIPDLVILFVSSLKPIANLLPQPGLIQRIKDGEEALHGFVFFFFLGPHL